MRPLRLVTRGSALAMAQAEIARRALLAVSPGLEVDLVAVSTAGDRDSQTPLSAMPEQGVFVGGLREALLDARGDVAVHSLKDVPTAPTPGLLLAAILERGDARDVFVGRDDVRLLELPAGARVGTSSTRRAAMVRALRPDLDVKPIRGNVDTRLRRVAEGVVDGVLLAGVGLLRLGRAAEITEWLDTDRFVPAPGQGAIALECRADDHARLGLLARVDHGPTRAAVTAERAFLAAQGRNCTLPVGAFAEVQGDRLRLRATLDGDAARAVESEGSARDAEALGSSLGRLLRDRHDGRAL